jgi:ABC-type Na+ efflux pump permease subunit
LRGRVGGGGIWSRVWTVSFLNIVFGLQDLQLQHTRRKSGLEFSFFLVSDRCGVSLCAVSVFSVDMLFWISFLLVSLLLFVFVFAFCSVFCSVFFFNRIG